MNNFTKADLKTGMIVKTRHGYLCEVTEHSIKCNFALNRSISDYDENLKNRVNHFGETAPRDSYDIVEIYRPIWTEPKRMTQAEIEAALGYEVEIVPPSETK